MNKDDVFTTQLAKSIFTQKYSKDGVESWADTCKRVTESVCSQLIDNKSKEKIFNIMYDRKFIPGGRYLYSAGRPFHQVNNCFLFKAEDSREGWADAMNKATTALMTGGGIGFDYSSLRPEGALIRRTGGVSTGPIALMEMINEAGRFIMQGGSRRSAIWAGLNWSHNDVNKFLNLKNYSNDLKSLKEKDFMFRLPMELTNISVIYDTEFFIAMENENHPKHEWAKKTWLTNCRQAFSTAEPGMSFNFRKDNESLRNAPVAGQTRVLTINGYQSVIDILNKEVTIWTGKQWAKTIFKKTKENSNLIKIDLSNGRNIICDPEHPFIAKNYIGAGKNKKIELKRIAASNLNEDQKIFSDLPSDTVFSNKHLFNLNEYGLGLAFKCNIKIKEELLNKSVLNLDFIAGWFDADGCYMGDLLRISNVNKNYLYKLQESLDFYGIKSVVREDGTSSYVPENTIYTLAIFKDSLNLFKSRIPTIRLKINNSESYRNSEIRVVSITELDYKEDVYCCDVGVEEHSFMAEGVLISNCTEITSEDDSDKCNLGTVWINRIKDKKELAEVIKYSVLFLLCGSIYSDVPNAHIREVGNKNNRIGLGLGGIHEWLMLRKEDYIVTPELHKWLSIYEQESDAAAYIFAKQLDVAVPKGIRAIAPTGSIGILAETTTGIEPLFCKAYKRRYLKDNKWLFQYVIDGSVKRLMEKGIPVEFIKDSYDLTFKQRVKFQADVQNYVDMAISSTCNIPMWGSEKNNNETLNKYSEILLYYAKRLRGFTVYPDGCRTGQPLTQVPIEEAMNDEGKVFEENETECINGVCGI